MCSYCGCDAIEVVGRLMDEHTDLINRLGLMRTACASGDAAAIKAAAEHLAAELMPHADAEEAGIFPVLGEKEEFAPTIERLIGEHRRIEELHAAVLAAPERFDEYELYVRDHFDREENGLFPASAIELADGEWERVHQLTPPPTYAEGIAHPYGDQHDHSHDYLEEQL